MALGKVAAQVAAAAKHSHDLGQERLYKTLCNVLDSLRAEAPGTLNVYHPPKSNQDAVVQARSRALLHLYLKTRFGLGSFAQREVYVTDGANDGGIDAFYIDENAKRIHILQSKFRANAKNFSESLITVGELLKIDVTRVLKGQKKDEGGQIYNDKITKGLQKSI